MNFGKIFPNMIFWKWGAGVKGRSELFQKFIRFGMAIRPLVKIESQQNILLGLREQSKQAHKLGRCDSYLRNLKTLPSHWLTHSLANRGRC